MVIEYNPSSSALADAAGGIWDYRRIVAHEIGHLVQGHNHNSNIDPDRQELDADRFSGFVLRKLSIVQRTGEPDVYLRSAAWPSDQYFPAPSARARAFADGWHSAAEVDGAMAAATEAAEELARTAARRAEAAAQDIENAVARVAAIADDAAAKAEAATVAAEEAVTAAREFAAANADAYLVWVYCMTYSRRDGTSFYLYTPPFRSFRFSDGDQHLRDNFVFELMARRAGYENLGVVSDGRSSDSICYPSTGSREALSRRVDLTLQGVRRGNTDIRTQVVRVQ